jgi:hypothetical protein
MMAPDDAWPHATSATSPSEALVGMTVTAVAGVGSPAAVALADAVLRDLRQRRLATVILLLSVALGLLGLIWLGGQGAWAGLPSAAPVSGCH